MAARPRRRKIPLLQSEEHRNRRRSTESEVVRLSASRGIRVKCKIAKLVNAAHQTLTKGTQQKNGEEHKTSIIKKGTEANYFRKRRNSHSIRHQVSTAAGVARQRHQLTSSRCRFFSSCWQSHSRFMCVHAFFRTSDYATQRARKVEGRRTGLKNRQPKPVNTFGSETSAGHLLRASCCASRQTYDREHGDDRTRRLGGW